MSSPVEKEVITLNALPGVWCPHEFNGIHQVDVAHKVVQDVQQLALHAREQVTGFDIPAAEIIFKDKNTEPDIRATYGKSATWPNIEDKVPLVVCINTPDGAADFSSKIWDDCKDNPVIIHRHTRLKYPTVYLCPNFWTQLEDETLDPIFERCPVVENNVLAMTPEQRIDPSFWYSKLMMMFLTSLRLYDASLTRGGSLTTSGFNDVLALQGDAASRNIIALTMFVICKSRSSI